jgi:hypothetical protein
MPSELFGQGDHEENIAPGDLVICDAGTAEQPAVIVGEAERIDPNLGRVRIKLSPSITFTTFIEFIQVLLHR